MLEPERGDLLREGVALILREVMELEVVRLAGAERSERSEERAAMAFATLDRDQTGQGATG